MEQTKLAIQEIAAFRAKLGSLLTEEHLRHRCDNVLVTLENGLRFMVNMPVIDTATIETPYEPTPITHVMGQAVTPRTAYNTADTTPDNEDVAALRKEVEEAYKTFAARSNESILESLEDMTIRGVAMKAGVEVTSTYPTKVDAAFIDEIKAAIYDKETVKLAGERSTKVNEIYDKFNAGYMELAARFGRPAMSEDMAKIIKAGMLQALENGQDLDEALPQALEEAENQFQYEDDYEAGIKKIVELEKANNPEAVEVDIRNGLSDYNLVQVRAKISEMENSKTETKAPATEEKPTTKAAATSSKTTTGKK